jgi:hypothetical protein
VLEGAGDAGAGQPVRTPPADADAVQADLHVRHVVVVRRGLERVAALVHRVHDRAGGRHRHQRDLAPLGLLRHRQGGGGGAGADHRHDLLVVPQVLGDAGGLGRVRLVVADDQLDLPAAQDALLVDVADDQVDRVELDVDADGDLAVPGGRLAGGAAGRQQRQAAEQGDGQQGTTTHGSSSRPGGGGVGDHRAGPGYASAVGWLRVGPG